jgi:hypothetical protein
MPITVACNCGKRFRVRDEHAGKRGKCPSCGAAVTIPAPGAEAPQSGARACPACARPLAPEAVLCVNCGYDTRAGKKLSVRTSVAALEQGKKGRRSYLPDEMRTYRDWDALVYVICVVGAAVGLGAGMLTGFVTIHKGIPQEAWPLTVSLLKAIGCFFGGAISGAIVGWIVARTLPN